jgi:flagellin
MSNSINTNVGAMVALASLRTAQSALDVASKQVQTGYRVSDAADDASTFSVAQGIRGNLQAYQAVQGSLANGVGLGAVTQAALTGISDMLGKLHAKMIQVNDGSNNATQDQIYRRDAREMLWQIENFIEQANYNGTNLLSAASESKTFLADTAATTLTMSAQSGVYAAYLAWQPGLPGTINSTIGDLQTFQQSVAAALGQIAAETRTLKLQSNFVNSVVDATTTGLGAIVDADIGKASASVQALQVRQQLGIQSLSIANQQPSVLLGLFR